MSFLNNQSSSSSSENLPAKTLSPKTEKGKTEAQEIIKLAPSLWLRAMTDFDAPFGHDGLPTVWG